MKRLKQITTHELMEYFHREDITRFVQYEESKNEKILTFCNTLRIKRIAKRKRFVFEGYKINGMNGGEWVKEGMKEFKGVAERIKLLFLVSAAEDRSLISYLLNKSINYRLNTLFALGYKVKGKTEISLVKNYRETRWKFSFASSNDFDRVLKKMSVDFDVTDTKKINVKRKSPAVCNGSLAELLVWRLCYKLNQGYQNSAKLINKKLRDMLCADAMSNVFKFNVLKYNKTAFQVSLNDYISFVNKFNLTGDCDNLIPLLRLVDSNRVVVIDGSNKSFVNALSSFEFSKGDISFLRTQSPSIVSSFSNFVRRYKHNKNCYISILKNENCKKYPRSVIVEMLNDLNNYTHNPENLVFITNKWLEYYQRLWKERGYKDARDYWHNAITSWRHALDWCERTNPLLHKNQLWSSIYELSNAWFEDRDDALYMPKPWGNIYIGGYTDSGFLIEEITDSDSLKLEGKEMHHCVASYAAHCSAGKYAVFSVKHVTDQSQRGTLGVSVNHDGKISYDQLQGACNLFTSHKMESFAKKFIKHLNSRAKTQMEELAAVL